MSESITNLTDAVAALGALPMPVGPEPQADDDRAKAPRGRGEDGRPLLPMGAHWTDVPELVDREVAKIQGRVDGATSGHWYDASVTETWRAPGTVRTNVDGYQRGVGQFIARPGDMDLVLHAHDDLSWCLGMIAKFRARVAVLEAERHTTNEALDDAVQELRLRNTQRGDVEQLIEAERGFGEECVDIEKLEAALSLGSDEGAGPDGITRQMAPVEVLREDDDVRPQVAKLRSLLAGQREAVDGEHYAAVHHSYRTPRDLPESGGAQ